MEAYEDLINRVRREFAGHEDVERLCKLVLELAGQTGAGPTMEREAQIVMHPTDLFFLMMSLYVEAISRREAEDRVANLLTMVFDFCQSKGVSVPTLSQARDFWMGQPPSSHRVEGQSLAAALVQGAWVGLHGVEVIHTPVGHVVPMDVVRRVLDEGGDDASTS